MSLRRLHDEDEDEDRAAKRPAYGIFSPMTTRSRSRRLETESSRQTRSRSRALNTDPVNYGLPIRTRRVRTVARGGSLAGPVASTSSASLAGLQGMPIAQNWVPSGQSTYFGAPATSSRAAPIFDIRVPSRRLSSYVPSASTSSSTSWLSSLPRVPARTGGVPNFDIRVPERRLSTGHGAAPIIRQWAFPPLLPTAKPVTGEDTRFMMQTPYGLQFMSSLARLDENDEEEDVECVFCFDLLKNGERLTSPPCGHLIHDKCLRDWHTAAREKAERQGIDFENYECPTCFRRLDRVADIIDAKNFRILNYPFDMRHNRNYN